MDLRRGQHAARHSRTAAGRVTSTTRVVQTSDLPEGIDALGALGGSTIFVSS